jgi:xanthine dehydrogenase YagT iron-sulfur-binding subunit
MNEPQGRQNKGGLSRRDFLRGSGAAAAASALTQSPLPVLAGADAKGGAPEPDAVAMGPGPVKIDLTVDGKKWSTSVEPRVTLLDALRNYIHVTGCKRVCDRGTCGACTVMLDNKVVYSCTTLAVEARGKEVRTAESLMGPGDKLDKVPAAFVQYDAQQCGFCTPGFVVAMKAAFEKNPKATPQEVEEALSGNICRCGTYQQMRDAVVALCKEGK